MICEINFVLVSSMSFAGGLFIGILIMCLVQMNRGEE